MPRLERPAREAPPKMSPEEAKAAAEEPREGNAEFARPATEQKSAAKHVKAEPAESREDRLQREAVAEIDLTRTLGDDDEYLSVLYWGPYGSGKTTHGASMAKLDRPGRLVAVNSEGGLKKNALVDWGIDPTRISPFPSAGTPLTYELLEKLFYKMAHDLATDPTAYLGTMWDSATSIHQYLLDQVIDKTISEQEEIVAKAKLVNKRAGNIVVRDRFETDGDDYAYMSQQFRHLLRMFRYLPCHFVVTALVRFDDRGKSKQAKPFAPAINPALQNDLAGYVDCVIRTGVVETPGGLVWFGRTVSSDEEDNKDRYNRLPKLMANPTFPRVLAYVSGELKEADDPDQTLLQGIEAPKVGKTKPAVTGTPAERAAKRKAAKAAEQQPPADEAQATPPPPAAEEQPAPTKPARKTAAQRRVEKEAAESAAVDDATKSRDQELYGDDRPPY